MGPSSYTQIAKWETRLHPQLRHALGFTAKQTPAASTFHYLYQRLDITALEKTLTHWTTQTLARLNISTDALKGLAIDGKVLGNSHIEDARRTHLLAACLHEVGIPTSSHPWMRQTHPKFNAAGLKIFTQKDEQKITDALQLFASKPKLAVNLIK